MDQQQLICQNIDQRQVVDVDKVKVTPCVQLSNGEGSTPATVGFD